MLYTHFSLEIQEANKPNLPMPWWWYSIEVTPSNLKPSKPYSSIHHRRFDRRNRSTSQLAKHTGTHTNTQGQINKKLWIIHTPEINFHRYRTFPYWYPKLHYVGDGVSVTGDGVFINYTIERAPSVMYPVVRISKSVAYISSFPISIRPLAWPLGNNLV